MSPEGLSLLIIVLGVLRDKQWKKIARLVDFYADEIIFTEPVSERALSPVHFDRLQLKSKYCIINDPLDAYRTAISNADPDCLVVVTGSMYLVGYIRKYISAD